MIRPRSSAPLLVAAGAVLLLLTWSTPASAQRHGHVHGPAVRPVVYFGGGFGYPGFFFGAWYPQPWYPWAPYGFGPYGPYGWYGPYGPYAPYGWYGYDEFTSTIRLEVAPREAEVFVDGYKTGTVDDFDGTFQRLRLRPGGHEVTIYLPGYRTISEQRYFRPGSNDKIRATMEPLGPGETSEPPPQPSPPAADRQTSRPRRYEPEPSPAREAEPAPARFGTLSLRVLPGDAELIVDGDRFPAPAGQDLIAIRLPEGRHRIEIQKEGYARYVEEILIRRDQTLTLNVSLKK